MFSKASIPPLNSFLWFTDNFFATRGIYKWCILVSQGNLFKDKRPNYFFRHHSKLPLTLQFSNCKRFEARSHFKSRLSLIVRVNVVLNRTVVVDSDWRFDNLCGSHLQSQSELYQVSWSYYWSDGRLRGDVIGRLSVKLWCYWLWRLVISNWCVSIRLLHS